MSLSKNTKRFEFTLNSGKEKDKVILDYLDNFYDAKDKIKEILYIAAVSNSDEKSLTFSNNSEQITTKKDTQSNKKSLTITNSKQQEIKKNELDQLKEFM